MEDGDDTEFEREGLPKFVVKVSNEAKLKELLRNLTSFEIKLCSDASKELGKPILLRWVLQQKEMYYGVLRGLENDNDDTVVYVLSNLRDRILIPGSLVPPGLRSALFGSVTLDQIASISGREDGGVAAELAHKVLVIVCTDPSNGLMPDLKRHPKPLRGNLKRLLDLMKKLKATEIYYHRDLLLAIVKGRPLFGSTYMDEFPYNLEDHTSPT